MSNDILSKIAKTHFAKIELKNTDGGSFYQKNFLKSN
jgi:hypothetical protein